MNTQGQAGDSGHAPFLWSFRLWLQAWVIEPAGCWDAGGLKQRVVTLVAASGSRRQKTFNKMVRKGLGAS